MKKKYTYKNGIIYISMSDKNSKTIYKATEDFLRKVIAEHKGAISKWQQ